MNCQQITDAAAEFYKTCHMPAPKVVLCKSKLVFNWLRSEMPHRSAVAQGGFMLIFGVLIAAIMLKIALLPPLFADIPGTMRGQQLPMLAIMFLLSATIAAVLLRSIFLLFFFGFRSGNPTETKMLNALRSALRFSGFELPAPSGTNGSAHPARWYLQLGNQTEQNPIAEPDIEAIRLALSELYIQVCEGRNANDLPLILQACLDLMKTNHNIILGDDVVLATPQSDVTAADKLSVDALISQGENHKEAETHQTIRERKTVLQAATSSNDPAHIEEKLRKLGLEQLFKDLLIRPIQTDDHGSLFRIGQDNPASFVRVEDQVRNADGSPQIHWLTVPPHIATASEGVAWTYHLGPNEYAPVTRA